MIAAKKEREARYRAVAVKSESPLRRKTVDEVLAENVRELEAQMEAEKKRRRERERAREREKMALEEAEIAAQIAAGEREALRVVTYPSVRNIIQAVADAYGISARQIIGRQRTRGWLRTHSRRKANPPDLVTPRHVAMYLCKKNTPHSFPAIAKQFDGRDHTTVIYANDKITARVSADEAFRAKVEAIEAAVGGLGER